MKQNLSFTEIKKRVEETSLPQFDLIIGIATGGVVPASLIAYKMNIDIRIVRINYRDDNNKPVYDSPVLLSEVNDGLKGKKLLLVDDVAVTGSTLEKAKSLFPGNDIKTLVFKGKADFVLFPEINTCVNWPWKLENNG